MSPRKLKAFSKAHINKEKRKDREMLIQATYIYEAYATVLSNAFGKKKIDWRTKTYSEEYEEDHLPDDVKKQRALDQFGRDMDARYREFQLAKARDEIGE